MLEDWKGKNAVDVFLDRGVAAGGLRGIVVVAAAVTAEIFCFIANYHEVVSRVIGWIQSLNTYCW